jgi:hypothetical protein
MATRTSIIGRGNRNAFDDIAASQTDSALIAAVAGTKLRVHAFAVSCGATPSTVVFNSKPAGAGTAVSPIFNNSISMPELQPGGWFETVSGEGLSVSTGAGSTTGVLVVYSRVKG